MAGEPTSSEQSLPMWAVALLSIAAGICLITSLWLAIHDKVPAGTLTAGLSVVCVLFIYLPRMQSLKAWGIEVVLTKADKVADKARLAEAEFESFRKVQIEQPGVPKEEVAIKLKKVEQAFTELSAANLDLSATLAPFRATKGSN